MRIRTLSLIALPIAAISLALYGALESRMLGSNELQTNVTVSKATAIKQINSSDLVSQAKLAERVTEKGLDAVAMELQSDPATVSLAMQRRIGLDEAAKRMQWQSRVSDFNDAASARWGERFGSVWVDVNDGDRVKIGIVAPTDADRSGAAELIKQHHLADAADVVDVRFSEHELATTNEWIVDQVNAANRSSSFALRSGLRPDLNAVTLVLPETKQLTAEQKRLVDEITVKFSGKIQLTYDDMTFEAALCNGPYCNAPIRGGIFITAANFQLSCSAAFTATGYGRYYLVTAGHCLSAYPGAWWTRDANGNYNEFGSSASYTWNSQGDMGIIEITNPGYWTPQPWLRITTPDQNVNYNEAYRISYTRKSFVGLNVCSVGKSTGSHCGNVVHLDGAYQYDGYGFTVNHMTEAAICNTAKGDSGGAVYTNKSAYGIISGRATDPYTCRLLYMEASRAESSFGITMMH